MSIFDLFRRNKNTAAESMVSALSKNEIVMDWSVPLQAFGGKTAMDVAKEAFALHETQQGFFYVYGEGDDWDSRKFGLYRSTVGEDVVGGDVFENITSFY